MAWRHPSHPGFPSYSTPRQDCQTPRPASRCCARRNRSSWSRDRFAARTCRESGKRHHPCVPVHPLWPQTPEQCPIPTIRGSHAPSCNLALIREVRSRTTPPRLHTLSCLITFIFWVELSGGSENLL